MEIIGSFQDWTQRKLQSRVLTVVRTMLKALCVSCLSLMPVLALAAPKITALILDGQNNHDWRMTTPVLKQELEETGLFRVDVATAPQTKEEMKSYRPDFSKYDVVVSNYTDFENGAEWPEATRQAFVQYVSSGGGFVVIHAASSAFPQWKAYNEIIGLGGWGGRDGHWGPYVYFRGGKLVKDYSPGPAGHHGKLHPYLIVMRDGSHPVTVGLPHEWMHTKDELYDHLRGPAENLIVLATAYSDPAWDGSGHDEPVIFTVSYGKGRIFNTTLGHDVEAMKDVGFITIFQRGTEWAATGRVTLPIPRNFPTATKVHGRP